MRTHLIYWVNGVRWGGLWQPMNYCWLLKCSAIRWGFSIYLFVSLLEWMGVSIAISAQASKQTHAVQIEKCIDFFLRFSNSKINHGNRANHGGKRRKTLHTTTANTNFVFQNVIISMQFRQTPLFINKTLLHCCARCCGDVSFCDSVRLHLSASLIKSNLGRAFVRCCCCCEHVASAKIIHYVSIECH